MLNTDHLLKPWQQIWFLPPFTWWRCACRTRINYLSTCGKWLMSCLRHWSILCQPLIIYTSYLCQNKRQDSMHTERGKKKKKEKERKKEKRLFGFQYVAWVDNIDGSVFTPSSDISCHFLLRLLGFARLSGHSLLERCWHRKHGAV